MPSYSTTCLRCGSLAFYELVAGDIVEHCYHCGALRFMERKMPGGMKFKTKEPTIKSKLPRNGTVLSDCLMCVVDKRPPGIQTEEVARILGLEVSLTATNLSILRIRNLVEQSVQRRGQKGGSIWVVTLLTKRLLQV